MTKKQVEVKRAVVSDMTTDQAPKAKKPAAPKKHGKFFWSCLIVAVVFFVLVAVFLATSQYLAKQYLASGNQEIAQYLYTNANQDLIFASTLSFFSSKVSQEAYVHLAEIANLRGDHKLSASYYQEAVTKKPTDGLRYKYAEQLFTLENNPEALNQLSKIQNPNDDAFFLFGHIVLDQNDFDTAQTYFEKLSDTGKYAEIKNKHLSYFALRKHDDNFLVLFPEQGNKDLRVYAEKALKEKTFSAVDCVTLGNFILEDGEPDFALDFATSALRLENNYRDAFTLRAQALASRRQYEEAQTSLDQALLISPLNEDLWYIQGQINEAQNNHTDALAAYKKASELGLDTALFHFSFARVARANSNFDTAITEANKALKLDAENDRTYWQFVFWTGLDAANYQEMQNAAKEYATKYPDEEFGVLAAALAEYKLQERTNFSDVIAEFIRTNPTSAFLAYLEGIDSLDQGITTNISKTKEIFTRAIDYDTNSGSNSEVAKHAQTVMDQL